MHTEWVFGSRIWRHKITSNRQGTLSPYQNAEGKRRPGQPSDDVASTIEQHVRGLEVFIKLTAVLLRFHKQFRST
ncbi:hypothetical protein PILCRDRAFT_829828 [Piloderma croceum F 1598]|uniref:Uncharacterized protein n=1 Tax=Piloderma croceum (strain F 1598) TaxID=765440 RepID=A0A0C3B4U6_PILCF|nr:hypothetical protein PILCRDRAFT_829828 [Piloderma croceum F 1598]